MSGADQGADEKTQAAIQRAQKSDAPTTQTGAVSEFQSTPPNPATGSDPMTTNHATNTATPPPTTTTGDYHPSQTVQQAEGTVEQKLESRPDDSVNASTKEQAKGLSSRVPQKHKERAAIVADRTKQFFNEEFPQERRDQFIWRMKKVRLNHNHYSLFCST
jgi:Family of unknown function (DUF5923)